MELVKSLGKPGSRQKEFLLHRQRCSALSAFLPEQKWSGIVKFLDLVFNGKPYIYE
jgi:hypothetical protein